jgi:hypothetical protein
VDASPVKRSTSRLTSGRTHTPWSCANPATMALSQSIGSRTARRAGESCATATSLGTSTIETTPEVLVRGFHGMGRSPVSRLILRGCGHTANLAVPPLRTGWRRRPVDSCRQLSKPWGKIGPKYFGRKFSCWANKNRSSLRTSSISR